MRGHHQKVVSFSFYGNKSSPSHLLQGFFQGIKENLRLLSVYYPNWVMRLYYDVDMEDPLMKDLCTIACEYDSLDLCYVR